MDDRAKREINVNTVLFLCSGNYYRSRFAEELFNGKAAARGVPWKADSAGLDLNPNNRGPVSSLVLDRLEKLGIDPLHRNRFPRPAESLDLDSAGVVVAMSYREHYGLMRRVFPGFVSKARYWDVGDTGDMSSAEALKTIEQQVHDLVDELQGGNTGLAGTG